MDTIADVLSQLKTLNIGHRPGSVVDASPRETSIWPTLRVSSWPLVRQFDKRCSSKSTLRSRLKFRKKPYLIPRNSPSGSRPLLNRYSRRCSDILIRNLDPGDESYFHRLYKLRSASETDDFANILPMSLLDRRQISLAVKSPNTSINSSLNLKCFRRCKPDAINNNSHAISCSTQARLNNTVSTNSNNASSSNRANSDMQMPVITIGELAAYFEEFVHLPKKMSAMAENMYM